MRDLLNHGWVVHLVHVYREANIAADHRVFLGPSNQLGVRFLMTPPASLGSFLCEDVLSVALPRDGFFFFWSGPRDVYVA